MQLRVICLQLLVATASATVASDTASASKRVDGSRSAAYGLGIVWASQPVRPNLKPDPRRYEVRCLFTPPQWMCCGEPTLPAAE